MYKIDLLPPELRRSYGVDIKRLLIIAAITTVATLATLFYVWFLAKAYFIKSDLADAEQKLNQFRSQAQQVEQLKQQRAGAEGQIAALEQIVNKKMSWALLLDDLNLNLPEDTWLDSLRLEGANLVMAGQSLAVPSVFVTVYNLNSLPYFNPVQILTVTQNQDAVNFTISAPLRR